MDWMRNMKNNTFLAIQKVLKQEKVIGTGICSGYENHMKCTLIVVRK